MSACALACLHPELQRFWLNGGLSIRLDDDDPTDTTRLLNLLLQSSPVPIFNLDFSVRNSNLFMDVLGRIDGRFLRTLNLLGATLFLTRRQFSFFCQKVVDMEQLRELRFVVRLNTNEPDEAFFARSLIDFHPHLNRLHVSITAIFENRQTEIENITEPGESPVLSTEIRFHEARMIAIHYHTARNKQIVLMDEERGVRRRITFETAQRLTSTPPED